MQESTGFTSIAPGPPEVLHSNAIAKQISPLPQAILRRVKEYMEARLEDNLSLDHLARETHYSRGHFLRMFQAATGKPPHQYLRKRRIERAKRMLRDEEETSLIDVAARCGFSSQSHMTRVFREQTGVTPSAFKRRPEVLACSSVDEELAMTEFVEMKIQIAVVALAEELNYARASEKLNITQPELKRQITELESQLELQAFRVSGEDVEVTEAGQVFVSACLTFLATRSGQGDKSKIQD